MNWKPIVPILLALLKKECLKNHRVENCCPYPYFTIYNYFFLLPDTDKNKQNKNKTKLKEINKLKKNTTTRFGLMISEFQTAQRVFTSVCKASVSGVKMFYLYCNVRWFIFWATFLWISHRICWNSLTTWICVILLKSPIWIIFSAKFQDSIPYFQIIFSQKLLKYIQMFMVYRLLNCNSKFGTEITNLCVLVDELRALLCIYLSVMTF